MCVFFLFYFIIIIIFLGLNVFGILELCFWETKRNGEEQGWSSACVKLCFWETKRNGEEESCGENGKMEKKKVVGRTTVAWSEREEIKHRVSRIKQTQNDVVLC